jgi:hypothetical protein
MGEEQRPGLREPFADGIEVKVAAGAEGAVTGESDLFMADDGQGTVSVGAMEEPFAEPKELLFGRTRHLEIPD